MPDEFEAIAEHLGNPKVTIIDSFSKPTDMINPSNFQCRVWKWMGTVYFLGGSAFGGFQLR